jgi:hypothetical protein
LIAKDPVERDNTVKVLSYNERRVRHVWHMNMKCSMEIIAAADQAMLHPKRP